MPIVRFHDDLQYKYLKERSTLEGANLTSEWRRVLDQHQSS